MAENALSVVDSNRFLALVEGSDLAEAMRENYQPGDSFSMSDLIRVKTPSSGGTIWEINGVAGTEHTPAITGILVFQAYVGSIWRTLDVDETKKDKPLVVSNDLITGRLNVPREEVPEEFMTVLDKHELPGQPGCYNWADLPWTQFGTGRDGGGKYAKESRVMFILREQDAWPLVVRCGPGSLGDVMRFIKRLDVPQYRAVVQLTLKKEISRTGKPYSKIVPSLMAKLDPAFGQRVKETYTDRLRKSHEAGMVVVDDSGEE